MLTNLKYSYLKLFVTLPSLITVPKRFSGKTPGPWKDLIQKAVSSKSIPTTPSSLEKPTSTFAEPKKTGPSQIPKAVPIQSQTFPLTDKQKQPSPPKPAGPLFKEPNFVMTNPQVQEFIVSKQNSTTTFTNTIIDNLQVPLEENPFKNQLSGIACLSSIEQSSLTDPMYRKKYAQIFFFEHTKILYYVFSKKLSSDEFFDVISKCFSIYPNAAILRRDSISYEIFTRNFANMCQHILTLLNPKKTFDLQSLKDRWGSLIDITYHKEYTVNMMIEFYIFCKIVGEFIKDDNFLGHIRSIDPTSPLLDNVDLFKSVECNAQISQKFGDIFIYFLKYKNNIIDVIRIYRDVKMDYKGPSMGHAAPIPFLTTDLTKTKQFMNDYTSYLQEKATKGTQEQKKLLQEPLNKLKRIQKGLTEDTIETSIKKFTKELLRLTFNEDFVRENINITIACDLEYNEDVALAEIIDKIQNDPDIINLFQENILYPTSNDIHKINWISYYKLVMEINERYSPNSAKTEIKAQFKESFIDFCKNHDINYDELI